MFERLTVYIDGEAREDHSRDTGKWKNGSRECMALLAAYEDTGLTPDEIAALRVAAKLLESDRDAERKIRLAAEEEIERLCAALKLAQARARDYDADIEAGRLVRFPVIPGQIVYVRRGCLTWGTFPGDSPWTSCEVITCKKNRSRTEFSLRPLEKRIMAGRVRYHRWASQSSIGLTVFLTEAAARAALSTDARTDGREGAKQ